jgi:AmmeMemoRadiSam system protein A
MDLSAEQCQILLNIARRAIRLTMAGDSSPPPVSDDPALSAPCGCFVTLHEARTHRLRGCIGRLQSNDPLIQTVHETAIGVLDDPRFLNTRVTRDDLPNLEIEVSILTPLQPAKNILDFEPQEDGIYLVFGDRSGCFLPQVGRETGWTREQLLDRLCSEKLGLSPYIWRNPHARLHKFRAIIAGPEAFGTA